MVSHRTSKRPLTPKQKALIRELRELSDLFDLDFWNIEDYPLESRTVHLELARDKIIRAQVVMSYALVDEFLNMIITDYFFGKRANYIKMWKTNRFRNFNYHILEGLSLLEKLRFANDIKRLQPAVKKEVERLNSLRNGIVHAFFPENLKKSKPVWKGRNIFSLDGAKAFEEDMEKLTGHFFRLAV